MGFTDRELELITLLKQKHESRGESFEAHLEGSVYKDYINYWDYVGIDALLNLQKPETKYPDEMTFIIYHQITELFFKLIIHEMEQIGYNQQLKVDFFVEKLNRINKYFHYLVDSFKVLSVGMEKEQFMKFRTALTPASGFQSIQFRLIELWSTKFRYLVSPKYRNQFSDGSTIEQMYPFIYWKAGATDMKTGQKKLTLIQFEDKYSKLILRKGNEFLKTNLCYKYLELSSKDRENKNLIEALKQYDQYVNVIWPLTHYNNATSYLVSGDKIAASTGGTNWRQYLPPWFQKQSFFPMIWSEEEMDDWGKAFADYMTNS
jgi:tryptophan 2,3-dioxygenase